MTTAKEQNQKLITRLLGIVAGMFAFGFALVPLYDVFCNITGINGKLQGQALYQNVKVNPERQVTVEFLTNISRGMPWEFKSMVASVVVHPGELKEVEFYARNPSSQDIVGQSVPSIAPGEASLYLHKTECFCFAQQFLVAGEEVKMPMKFYLDPDIPEHIDRLTISYQLFNVTDAAQVASSVQ